MTSYSVSVRLQRVTVEYSYVSVPISTDIVNEQTDGTARIDTTKLFQRATEIGESADLVWHQENVSVQLHPVQKAPEPDEIAE
jgi:hypothetical protein